MLSFIMIFDPNIEAIFDFDCILMPKLNNFTLIFNKIILNVNKISNAFICILFKKYEFIDFL